MLLFGFNQCFEVIDSIETIVFEEKKMSVSFELVDDRTMSYVASCAFATPIVYSNYLVLVGGNNGFG